MPFVLLALLAGSGAARAEVDPFTEPDEAELFRAEQRIVTVAARYAQTVEEAPSIVTVVTAAEMRRWGCRTLADVLQLVPGIHVTVSKEGRDLAWFRGVVSDDNNKYLLLVDGVPVYDGIYTHAQIDEYLPLEIVRQVEIIKGPGSAIYGTNAFAGVVNVVTWDADDLDGGVSRAVAGSDGRLGWSAVAGGRVGEGDASVRAYARGLWMDGDGPSYTPEDHADVRGLDPRRSIAAGLALRSGGLDVRVDLVDYRHTYLVNEEDDPLDLLLQSADDFYLAYRDARLAARWDLPLGATGRFTPWLAAQSYDRPGVYAWIEPPDVEVAADGTAEASLAGTLVDAEKRSARISGGVEFELHPDPWNSTVGGLGVETTHVVRLEDVYYVDFSHEATSGGFRADPTWIRDLYAFAQHTWTASWWLEVTGGLRLDHHSYFGPFLSPRAGLLVAPGPAGELKLLYGRAFRAPTARELLVAVATDEDGHNRFTAGNPGLRPEVIDTVELSVGGRPVRGAELRLAGFLSSVRDEIDKSTEPDPELGDDYYANLGETDIVGLEGEGSWTVGRLDLGASASLVHARDRETGALRYGYPPLMAHARAGWALAEGLRATLLADAVGTRPRAAWTPHAGLDDAPGYVLLNLGLVAGPFAGGRLSADLSVRNLLDAHYEHLVYLEDADAVVEQADGSLVPENPRGIEGEGRTVGVGVEARF